MITIEQIVQREVLCCMSSMVSTLAQGSFGIGEHRSRNAGHQALKELAEQASELASPVLDYEDATRQVGAYYGPCSEGATDHYWSFEGDPREDARCTTAEGFCRVHHIEPNEWEVYEHWAVSTWLAEKLQAQGQRVDTDFAGLNIWARTTTGQAISMDDCVQRIYQEMMK